MTVQWTHCDEVEREHRANKRQYAHTFHYPNTICLARAFWDLPVEHQEGLLLHEAGHLLAGLKGSEEDANDAAEQVFGGRIEYVDSPYGEELERVANVPRTKTVYVVKFKRGKKWVDSGYGEFTDSTAAYNAAVASGETWRVDRVKPQQNPEYANVAEYWASGDYIYGAVRASMYPGGVAHLLVGSRELPVARLASAGEDENGRPLFTIAYWVKRTEPFPMPIKGFNF